MADPISLTQITDKSEIKKALDLMVRLMRQAGAQKRSQVLSFPGGSEETDILVLDRRLWTAVFDGDTKWGVPHGFPQDLPNIVVETNVPKSGVDRKQGGAIGRDENGDLVLAHSGRIGGQLRIFNQTGFWRHHRGEEALLDDGRPNGRRRMAVVAAWRWSRT